MHTGHLASSHSLIFASVSEGIFEDGHFSLLELQGKGDALHLLEDTDRSLLSFGIFKCQRYILRNSLSWTS